MAGRVVDPDGRPVIEAQVSLLTVPGSSSRRTVTNFDGTVSATGGYRRALIAGRFKLIYESDQQSELYDLSKDPMELSNLIADSEYATVRTALIEDLLRWCVRLDDTLGVGRYEVVHPERNWYL